MRAARTSTTTDEDSSGIALNVKAGLTDTDGSETLSYQIKWASGQGTLTLNGRCSPGGERPLYGGRWRHQQGDGGARQGLQR
jgi:hypothetical protein